MTPSAVPAPAILSAVRGLLAPATPSLPDSNGFHSFSLPAGGVRVDVAELLTKAFQLADTDVGDLLPAGFPALAVSVTACRVSDTGIILEAQWSGFDAQKLATFVPGAGSSVSIALAVNATVIEGEGTILTVDLDVNRKLNLSGNVDFESGALGISANWPDGSPTLQSLLRPVDLDNIGFGSVAIEKIGVRGSPADGVASIDIEVVDLFSLDGHAFKISNAELALNYLRDGAGQLTGRATATAFLGNAPTAGQPDSRIQFDLGASFEGPDLGWTFTGEAQNISVAAVLGKLGVPADSPFNDLHVDSVELSFNTSTKDIGFTFRGSFPPVSANAAMVAGIKLARQPDGSYAKVFSGSLTAGPVQFDLVFDKSTNGANFVGTFSDSTAKGAGINVRDVVVAIAPADVAASLPTDPTFRVKDALFAFQRPASGPGKFLFAIDTDFSLNLSGLANLPLIGQAVAGEALEAAFEVLVHSEQFDPAPIRSLLPSNAPHIPDQLPGRFQLLTSIKVGDFTAQIDLGVQTADLTAAPAAPAPAPGLIAGAPAAPPPTPGNTLPATVTQPATDSVKWIDVQKHFGPLSVQRVGLSFDTTQKKIGVFLEADLSVSGLTLSVEGLGAVYDLRTKQLSFALRGLGIDFSRGGIEIGGGFLNQNGDFAGKIVIRAKSFTLAALGAVAVIDGQPSIFIYGLLNYPLGGPAFFFVEGLAAGFGYNRSLRLPAIEDVRDFPLVTDALAETAVVPRATGDSDKAAVAAQLARLHDYVSPVVGEYFFAAGIKFSSFKLLNSFLLVGIVAGKSFEIDLIGVSTYQNPPVTLPDVPPLAHIELNLTGRIAPDEGFAVIRAQLTKNSFVYSNLVQLSGGFAFATWFAEPPGGNGLGPHAGDFVLTVGGYHPRFVKPAWYPDVPRLGITYQVTDNILVKGTAYFALTPSVLMAGAALEATATVGPISAAFKAAVDFLIGWEPYHYDASITISIKIHFIGDFEAGVDLRVFGPPFSGVAHVFLSSFSFTVSWGEATAGDPTPIPWSGADGFRTKFLLTAADEATNKRIATVRIVAGTIGSVAQTGGGELQIVSPGAFRIETSCPIPFDTGTVNASTVAQLAATAFGVAPMAVASASATHALTFNTLEGSPVDASHFAVSAVAKKFPPALWGKQFQMTDPAAPTPLVDAFGGLEISPAASLDDGTAVNTERRKLDFSSPSSVTVAPVSSPVRYSITGRAPAIRPSLASAGALRSGLLAAVGLDAAAVVSISDALEASFVTEPALTTVLS